MGSVYFDDILISEGLLDAERLLNPNEQVGGLPRRQSASATQIVTAANGELVFGEELEFSVVLQRRTVRVADAVTYSWWQLEAKADAGTFKGGHLFVSEHPWSACYATDMRFKATRREAVGLDEKPENWPKEMSLDQVIARTRNFTHDFWETSSKVRTATLDAPGQSKNIHRTKQASDAWLTFGVSMEASAEQLEKKLLKDPVIKGMLAQTTDRSIVFVPRVAQRNDAGLQKLHTAVVPDALASMHTAVRQALAGVPGDHAGLDAADWYGEPVSTLVSIIYRQHLYDAHRRATYGDKKTHSLPQER